MRASTRTYLLAFIGIPIWAHIVAFGLGGLVTEFTLFQYLPMLTQYYSRTEIELLCVFILGCVAMFFVGWLYARFTRPARNAPWRHGLLLLPALIVLAAWVGIMQCTGYSFDSEAYISLFTFSLPWWGMNLIALLTGQYWAMVLLPVGYQVGFTLGYYWQRRRLPAQKIGRRFRPGVVAAMAILSLIAVWQAKLRADKFVQVKSQSRVSESVAIRQYRPDREDNLLLSLQGKAPFQIVEHWPRWDGATAAYPLYASAFFALNSFPDTMTFYNIQGCCLENSRTPEAYQNIIDNKADIIFVAQPSEGQKKRAQEAKVSLSYTPFAREAFVFIVSADNPVDSLSEQQVRDIFSGKITRWREVGGNNDAIQVWQRPADSGSQTVMLAKVMKQTPMMPAQETEISSGMDGIIRQVAEYQNTPRAIGYTFRYYATKINADKGIKLLAINGIAPTEENIGNGSYPYSTDVYMVTRKNATADTQKIVDWFLSPQGQRLVQDVGYVPLYRVQK